MSVAGVQAGSPPGQFMYAPPAPAMGSYVSPMMPGGLYTGVPPVAQMPVMGYGDTIGITSAVPSAVPMMPGYGGLPPQVPSSPFAGFGGMPPPVGPPQLPQKLTEGFPDPASVETQKAQYASQLEAQLKAQSDELQKQSEIEKKMLADQAAAAKANFNLQVDSALQQQARTLDEQTNAAMLAVHEKAVQQKSALEGQASGLKLEFEQKKAQESMLIRQYEIQKQYYEKQMQLQAQMQQMFPGAMPLGPQHAQPKAAPVPMPQPVPNTTQKPRVTC